MSDSDDDVTTRKRRAEEEHSGAPSAKRPRRFQEIDKLNNEWRTEIAILQTRLESIGNYHNIPALETDSIKSGLITLLHMCKLVAIRCEPSIDSLNAFKLPFLDAISIDQLAIPDSVPAFRASIYKTVLESLKAQLVVVQKLTEELLNQLSSLPSAAEYAYLSVWSVWQKKDTAILNLRPPNNMCLPLTVLHPAFARLLKSADHEPDPRPGTQASDVYISALRVAFALCEHMPEPYEEDESRCRDLCHQLRGLLGSSLRKQSLHIESNHPLEAIPSKADLYVEKNGFITALGIVKAEFESGDPYMSVSRAYQALVHKLLTTGGATDGAPCILISVAGPLFMISGAFYDGKHCIVEPLVGPYTMFRRNGHSLGTALFAMHQALDEFATRSPGPSFPPCVPRVYHSYTDSGGHTHSLNWEDSKMVRTSDPPNNLLFTASTLSNSDPSTSHRVLVKLMARHAHAGLQVHKLLDDVDLAPHLLGTAELEGLEFAVVMEYLAPEDGWMTLQAYLKAHPKVNIGINHPGLQKALQVMKEGKVVHGDFRPYNIMVRSKNTEDVKNDSGDVEMIVGGQEAELEIRVIDFESSGELGKAKYPWRLNERIPWPGKPGALIGEYDDVTLLYRTLDIKQKGWA